MIAKNNNIYLMIMYFIFIVILSLIISSGAVLHNFGDDIDFMNLLNNSNLLDVAIKRYFEWSGRVTIDALLIATINYHWFWKILIPMSVFTIAYSLWALLLQRKTPYYFSIPLISLSFFLITPSVNFEAFWWITGFYNYALPFSAGIYSLLVLHESELNHIFERIIALILLLLSCFSEQIALFMVIATLFIIYNKSKRNSYDITFTFLVFAFNLILFLAPGNKVRFIIASFKSMPEYGTLDFLSKIATGVDRLNHHLTDHANLLFELLCLSVIILTLAKKRFDAVSILAFFIVMLKIIGMLTSNLNSNMINYVNMSQFFTADNWNGYMIYVSFFLSLCSIPSLIFLLFINCNFNYFKLHLFFIVYAAISVVIIAFSPTVYDSSQRVLFMFDVCVMMSLITLANEFFPFGKTLKPLEK